MASRSGVAKISDPLVSSAESDSSGQNRSGMGQPGFATRGVEIYRSNGLTAAMMQGIRVPAHLFYEASASVYRSRCSAVEEFFNGHPRSDHGTKVITNSPASVPAYTLFGSCGSIARLLTGIPGRPELTALQFSPPSVLRNTPVSVPTPHSHRRREGATAAG